MNFYMERINELRRPQSGNDPSEQLLSIYACRGTCILRSAAIDNRTDSDYRCGYRICGARAACTSDAQIIYRCAIKIRTFGTPRILQAHFF